MSKDTKELLSELAAVRKDVSTLRSKLNDLNTNKEGLFIDKDKFSKEIKALISEIKKFKDERNSFTNKVKELKKERKVHNDKLKVYSEKFKELIRQRDDLKKAQKIKGNPDLIMKEIDSLEFKIETEGMTFDTQYRLPKRNQKRNQKMNQKKSC